MITTGLASLESAERVSVKAILLTYRRPDGASRVLDDLLENEGLDPAQILLAVNGDGGLLDSAPEGEIEVLRLAENLGPAGGFARSLEHARATSEAPWFYLCEDDQARHDLPAGRIADLIEAVERFERDVPGPPVGAVVASGRHIDLRTGRTSNHVFGPRGARFEEVDYGPFFGALLSRRVLGARVVPDEDLFWWAEDLDFSLRIREAGFRVLVDTVAQKATRDKGSSNEPWCGYYMARNNFHLRRRYGGVRWDAWHILKSARRLQRAPTNAHRIAILRGFLDGVRGRRGRHPEFSR